MKPYDIDGMYVNVEEIAERNGLVVTREFGHPRLVDDLIALDRRDPRGVGEFGALFDHTVWFKPQGRGQMSPVMAITSPYRSELDDPPGMAQAFAAQFGLAARVDDPAFCVYRQERTIPIVFWRPDLHLLR